MSPRMRPSSTRRLTSSSATVVPKTLRSPRASIVAITLFPLCLGTALRSGIEFFLRQIKRLNLFREPRPFIGQKFLAFALQQQIAGAGFHDHPEPSPLLDLLLMYQLLIRFENTDAGDPISGRLGAD